MKKYKYFDWLKRIIVVLFFAILFFPTRSVNAMTQEDAGETLSQFALNFYRDHRQETAYSLWTWVNGQEVPNSDRKMAYKGIKQYNGSSSEYYGMDCVGWVSFAIHYALNLGDKDTFTFFAVPPGGGNTYATYHGFEEIDINSQLMPGDILCYDTHIGIYAVDHSTGTGYFIHSWGGPGQGITETTLDEMKQLKPGGIIKVIRISEQAAAGLNESACTTIFGSYTGAATSDDYGQYWGTTSGRYVGSYSYSFGDWLFDKLKGFFDYLIGMLTMIIRIPILGWTNIIEVMVSEFFEDLEGVEEFSVATNVANAANAIGTAASGLLGTTSESEDKLYELSATDTGWKRVNVEDVIFNRVPMLDVNVFSFKKAGGKDLQPGSVIYTLRENVATWYTVIRRVSIILELLILIYLGIQIAISTAAGKRAKYQSMLVAWVTSFIVIFTIHYYMIAIVYINDFLVGLFYQANVNAVQTYGLNVDGAVSIYDSIRTRAYSIKLSEGVPATVMYMVLVYYLIKYLYIYFKRYLTVNILVILAPFISIKYAFDRIKSGKASSLSNWMFDFFINVFLQSIHAMLYTVFMTMAFKMATESIAGFVVALIILHFIPKTEQLFLNIFRFESKGNTLKDTRENRPFIRDAVNTGIAVGLFAKGTTGLLIGGGRLVGGLAYDIAEDGFNAARFVFNPLANRRRVARGEEAKPYEGIDIGKALGDKAKKVGYKIGDRINGGKVKIDKKTGMPKINKKTGEVKKTGLFKGNNLRLSLHKLKEQDPKLYEAAKKALDSNKQRIKKNRKRTLALAKKGISGMGKVFVGIPMAIVDSKEGILVLTSGIRELEGLSKNKKKYGHRIKYRRGTLKQSKGRIAAGGAAAVGGFVVGGLVGGIPGALIGRRIAKNKARGKEYVSYRNEIKEIRGRRGNNSGAVASNVFTMGVASGIAQEIENVKKDSKDNRKMQEKISYLSEIARMEGELGEDIDKKVESILIAAEMQKNDNSKGEKTDEEKKRIEEDAVKELKQDVRHAMDSVLNGKTINDAVKDYMYKNDITEMKDSDVEAVLKQLENNADIGNGLKLKFGDSIKNKVKESFKQEISKNGKGRNRGKAAAKGKEPGLDDKKTSSIIQDAIGEENSVTIETKPREQGKPSKEIEPKYPELTQKIREFKTLAEKGRIATGSNLTDVNRFINNRIETAKTKAIEKLKK